MQPMLARMGWVPSLYKARGVPVKSPVCAICADRTRGKTIRLSLGYGVGVSLCESHAAHGFQTMRGGRDFCLTLQRLWEAHGCLTRARSRALDAHLRRVREAARPTPRLRPGSYAWPSLRVEAEQRAAAGHDWVGIVAALRLRHAGGPAKPPSVRTVHRWLSERRHVRPPPAIMVADR